MAVPALKTAKLSLDLFNKNFPITSATLTPSQGDTSVIAIYGDEFPRELYEQLNAVFAQRQPLAVVIHYKMDAESIDVKATATPQYAAVTWAGVILYPGGLGLSIMTNYDPHKHPNNFKLEFWCHRHDIETSKPVATTSE